MIYLFSNISADELFMGVDISVHSRWWIGRRLESNLANKVPQGFHLNCVRLNLAQSLKPLASFGEKNDCKTKKKMKAVNLVNKLIF